MLPLQTCSGNGCFWLSDQLQEPSAISDPLNNEMAIETCQYAAVDNGVSYWMIGGSLMFCITSLHQVCQ